MRGRRIPIKLPNTGALSRRKQVLCIRIAVVSFFIIFVIIQLNVINYDFHDPPTNEVTNDSSLAILQNVPPVFHKFLKPKNNSQSYNNSHVANSDKYQQLNISDIKRNIEKYNEYQTILNEETFGPLQNDSVIIVIQVHKRIKYLRHLIVSLAQATGISKTLLVFSHDFYDEEINELVQSIDFCKVMQIFYPYSIQTHPNEFPGTSPEDCPRDMKKEQALAKTCINANYPDLYGHYREAKFTQTKHHWFWKANRVFDQLDVTRYHTGLVLFLEEDHYVAEDFIYLLNMMQKKSLELCPKCNIISLGTYLKTFNYYTYNNNHKKNNNNNKKALFGYSYTSSASGYSSQFNNNNNHNQDKNYNLNKNKNYLTDNKFYERNNYGNTNNNNVDTTNNNNNNNKKSDSTTTEKYTWGFQVLPTLYSVYQKVEVTPWISSKHNMGMAFNKSTWNEIKICGKYFCQYDDYNWDWSLQHVSQQCLKKKLYAMVVRGPRVFHIGECGVHHKKNNCESNQVISKVQQVINVATKAKQFYPKSLTLTVASVIKKTKLRKGNGGWGDKRDHQLCMNMTLAVR